MAGPRGKARTPRAAARKKAAAPPIAVVVGHGGARKGAGRKKDALPEDVLADLGPPPLDSSLLTTRWWNKLLALLGWLRARGLVGRELAGDLRSLAATAGKLVPEDLRAAVDELMKEREKKMKPEAQGPQLEEHLGEQPSLRGTPR
jgi:hypothetical protein